MTWITRFEDRGKSHGRGAVSSGTSVPLSESSLTPERDWREPPAPFPEHLPGRAVDEELGDIEMLHRISLELIGEQDLAELYGKIVDAAISICRSQFGTMQLLCAADGAAGQIGYLQLLCSRGLPPDAVAFWQRVDPSARSSCTLALKSGKRAIIEDYETWDEISGSDDLQAFRRTGIRSAQTTPLLTRSGRLLGMISTHWSEAHTPSPRDLRLLDILARQAADLLERTMADEVSRAREQELQVLNLELRHRLKNTLAIVQTLSRQTLKGVENRVAVDALLERLIALGAAHDVLFHEGWTSTTIEQISRASVSGVAGLERVSFHGPALTVGPRAAVALSLVLHELATNAIKYGALSVSEGEVDITWRVDAGLLRFSWDERGGPAAATPLHAGFGSRLISMGFSPGSKVDRDFVAAGLQVRITAPLPELTEDLALSNAELAAR